MDTKEKIEQIKSFIKSEFANANKGIAVVGVSGGIDSAVILKLCIDALGLDNVRAVCLPYEDKNGTAKSLADAMFLLGYFDIRPADIIYINAIVGSIAESVDLQPDHYNYSLRLGNIMARTRMILLYDCAAKYNGLVVGTTNKSEQAVGYFTKWGDGAVDIEPIMHLTKTEVYEVATELDIPGYFINKKPSADLWEGQTDENEMGFTYSELDGYLNGTLKVSMVSSVNVFKDIETRIKNNKHKIKPIPSLS